MQTFGHTAETFWSAYLALSRDEREAILRKFIAETELYEDRLDTETFEKRMDEPSIAVDEYLEKRAQRKSE